MATIVNTPAGTADSGSGMGMFFGVLALLVLVVMFVLFGLPAIRGGGTTVAPQAPAQQAPGIQVPEKIDVNVNQPNGQ